MGASSLLLPLLEVAAPVVVLCRCPASVQRRRSASALSPRVMLAVFVAVQYLHSPLYRDRPETTLAATASLHHSPLFSHTPFVLMAPV